MGTPAPLFSCYHSTTEQILATWQWQALLPVQQQGAVLLHAQQFVGARTVLLLPQDQKDHDDARLGVVELCGLAAAWVAVVPAPEAPAVKQDESVRMPDRSMATDQQSATCLATGKWCSS